MSFESKFPNLYKGSFDEEIVSTWRDIHEIEKEQHPRPKDTFNHPTSGSKLQPTHFTVKVPPNTLVVYYPNPNEHTMFSPFRPGEIVLYLGEVQHMCSHGAFVDRNGKIQYGYHTWSFRVIPPEDV